MFGFGGLSEVVFILFLAMLIFGPEKLPEMGRKLAKIMAEVRKASNELKRTFNAEVAISEQEAEARRNQQANRTPPAPSPAAWWSGEPTGQPTPAPLPMGAATAVPQPPQLPQPPQPLQPPQTVAADPPGWAPPAAGQAAPAGGAAAADPTPTAPAAGAAATAAVPDSPPPASAAGASAAPVPALPDGYGGGGGGGGQHPS